MTLHVRVDLVCNKRNSFMNLSKFCALCFQSFFYPLMVINIYMKSFHILRRPGTGVCTSWPVLFAIPIKPPTTAATAAMNI